MLRFLFIILFIFFFSACYEQKKELSGYNLPADCNGKCFEVTNTNSFEDAVRNSEECLCINGKLELSITIGQLSRKMCQN